MMPIEAIDNHLAELSREYSAAIQASDMDTALDRMARIDLALDRRHEITTSEALRRLFA